MHSIVGHPCLYRLIGGGVAGIGLEGRPVGEGIAHREEHIVHVPGRQVDRVIFGDRNAGETEQGTRGKDLAYETTRSAQEATTPAPKAPLST